MVDMAHVVDRLVEDGEGLWRVETRHVDDHEPGNWHVLARWLSRHEADLLLRRREALRPAPLD